jgi:hypothetical protein
MVKSATIHKWRMSYTNTWKNRSAVFMEVSYEAFYGQTLPHHKALNYKSTKTAGSI